MRQNFIKYSLSLFIISAIVFSFFTSIEFLLNFSNDDSFFYIKTAYNFSEGFGSTFDKVDLTNGYHPLWFLVLSFYYFILGLFGNFSPETLYRFTVMLILFLDLVTLIILYFFFRNSYGDVSRKYFFLSIPLFLLLTGIRDFGMETHLLCVLIASYLYYKSAELKFSTTCTTVKCVLLTLIFLTRVDYLFTVIPVIVTADYLTSDPATRNNYLKNSFIYLSAVCVIYFTVNYIFFGIAMPVTAKIKSTFPEILFLHNMGKLLEPGAVTNQFAKTAFTFATIISFLIISGISGIRSKLTKIDYFLLGMCIAAAAYLLLNILFNKHALKEWYVSFPAFVSSLLMIRIIMMIPKVYYLALGTFTFIFLFIFYITRIKNPKWNSAYYYAKEIKNQTEPDDRIYMIDLTGITGFFSERSIINGDGLINSNDYQEYLTTGNLDRYFKDKNIKYYSTYSQDNAPMELTDSAGVYTDNKYSFTFGNYPFIFKEKDLKLKFPYYYSYIAGDGTGYWYLFKLNNN
ncbi:MAG TPA: hypothetical protein PKA90_05305 [Ignavibacteria bacterium]|nr:hypothetical protein [Ignavibacteria bacterium]HMR39828.1 hypothetical protein [Ignavibacteria bacterium]